MTDTTFRVALPDACRSWSDHVFGEGKIVAHGTHPCNGAYVKLVSVCSRCGRQATETRWAPKLFGVLPSNHGEFKSDTGD